MPDFHTAITQKRLLSPVWIVPAIAALLAVYMIWHTFQETGPEITISFNSAEGLVAGQTQIKYKAVAVGTVSSITLSENHRKVLVRARINKHTKDLITDKTRFWVMRPRLGYGNASGFETLVSGAYIQCDPGNNDEEGEFKTEFIGMEEPGISVDGDGTIYTLVADTLGPINIGSPIYFRDVEVGEVARYELGDGFKPIKIDIFIRAPYDKFVHKETLFWNASSLAFNMNPTGLQVEFQSLQSVLVGGISFSTANKWKDSGRAVARTQFTLHANKQEADISDMKHASFVTYVEGDAKDVSLGSPVLLNGIQVGEVTSVQLLVDAAKNDPKVKIGFDIEPERMTLVGPETDPAEAPRKMAMGGLVAKVDSGLLLPQGEVSLEFAGGARKQTVAMEGDAIVIPSLPSSSMSAILNNLSDITHKLNQVPFAAIGNNVNNSLEGMTQQSDLQRGLKQTLDQMGAAARSVRLLADYLSHHPESLIRGRSDKDKGQ